MGMTIEKAKDILTSEDFAGYSISEILEARDITLDIMSKYQKIQAIINNAKDSDGAIKYNWLYEQIREVVEDGSD